MSELEAPIAQEPQAPPPEPVAEPIAEPESQALVTQSDDPPTDDAALNQQIAEQAIAVPDGEKLVPESLLRNVAINYRNKLKEAKQGSPEALALKQQLDEVQARLREAEPLAHAFKAIQNAQPQQVQQPQAAPQQPVEDTAELNEIAKDFDFYKPNGDPDLDRARRHQARVMKTARQMAEAQTAPLVQHTLSAEARHNVARAKATVHPVTKQTADPAIIDSLIAHVANQPGGLATLANPENVKQIWLNAYALSTFREQPAAPKAETPAPAPPVITERSGGAAPGQQKALSAAEKRAAKDAGLTEKQYLEIAQGMKW